MKAIIATLFLIFILTESAVAADYILIANESVTVHEISQKDAEQIFIGKKRTWDNGDIIVPVILNSGEAHNSFLKEVTKKSPMQFKTYWKKIVFTGKGQALKNFDSENDLVSFVKSTKGAVGYISIDTRCSGTKKISIK